MHSWGFLWPPNNQGDFKFSEYNLFSKQRLLENSVNITCGPGHTDLESNAKMDELARASAAGDVITIDCLRPFSALKCCLRQCICSGGTLVVLEHFHRRSNHQVIEEQTKLLLTLSKITYPLDIIFTTQVKWNRLSVECRNHGELPTREYDRLRHQPCGDSRLSGPILGWK